MSRQYLSQTNKFSILSLPSSLSSSLPSLSLSLSDLFSRIFPENSLEIATKSSNQERRSRQQQQQEREKDHEREGEGERERFKPDFTLTYGEISFESFIDILTIIRDKYFTLCGGEIFYDLGSGSGKASIAAALFHNFQKYCTFFSYYLEIISTFFTN